MEIAVKKKENSVSKFFKKNFAKMYAMGTVAGAMANATALTAFAGDQWDTVTIKQSDSVSASAMMGKIIGVLLTITRFIGVALVVYGVYEVVMSFMQNQPEAKTKGIVMALAGAVMIGLKSILQGLQIVS